MEPKSGYSGLSRSASIPTGWIAAKPLTEKRGDALKIIYYENIGIGLLTHTIETKKNALNVVAQMRVSLNEVLKHSTQSMAPSSVSHLGALHKQIEKLHNLLELRSYDSSEGLELILKSGGTIDNEIRKRKWIDKHREHISHVRRLQAIFRNRQKKQKPHKWHCLSIQFFTNFCQGDAYFKSELSKILKKRVKIITEIIETERNYFELMSLIPTYFSTPLKQQNILDADNVQKIFLNYENIIQICSKLLFRLTGNEQSLGSTSTLRRATSWVSKDDMEIPIASIMQKKSVRQDAYVPPVLFGKTFVEFAPYFRAYALYINQYDSAYDKLNQLCAQNPTLTSFIKQCEQKATEYLRKIVEISSILILPVQRLPRYLLLLRELQRYTPLEHLDYNSLLEAIEKLQVIATGVNETKRTLQNFSKLLEIQNSIKKAKFLGLAESHRIFIKEGDLSKLWGVHEDIKVFLFNDLLVACKKATSQLTLDELIVLYPSTDDQKLVEFEDAKHDLYLFCFCIKYRGEKYLFGCKTENEKKEWLQELSKLPKLIPTSFQTHVINDLFKPVKFEGKLTKKGPRSPQWKIRIFRLQGDSLFFFLPEKLTIPKGVIKLKDKARINFQLQLSKTKPNSFHLVPIEKQQMKRVWMLGAEDANSLKLWIHQFKLYTLLSDEAINK